MPASLDTISTVPAPIFDWPMHSDDNSSSTTYTYGNKAPVLPDINTYFDGFTVDLDDDVMSVSAFALLYMVLECLMSPFSGTQPKAI
ncbi:hypothetical protein ACHHYP_06810 [Achlya hypogyna]|uniref:Uncharacterized protein n=1 Tax=Achlya hypogyna TaxID=1202772 RepID=A0A1V9YRT7_ACHHY|nr:hypothetical protein ACHHYP_06810 [Achlya hypogyna]